MYRIIEHIYGVEGLKFGRIYVIEGEDGLTLIDTSTSNSLPQIGKELLKIGHKLGEIKRIVITHAHPDHLAAWRHSRRQREPRRMLQSTMRARLFVARNLFCALLLSN